MIIRAELRDKSFNVLEILDPEFFNLTWEYNRVGGCGSFTFDLPRQYCNEKYISGDFNLRLYARNPSTKDFDLWYQGIVESKEPNVRDKELISVVGHGYQAQLSRIQLRDVTFSSQEVSVIIKNILDNYVVPNTDITYDLSDIEATTFTVDSIEFNTDAESAFETLADITGSREWGVDKNRKFFFKVRSSTAGLNFTMGDKITGYTEDDSFKDIVNRVIIQGGDVADVPFRPNPTAAAYNNTSSQTKYGRRDLVYQNSSIITDSVAQQVAQSILAERSDVIRRARCEIAGHEEQIEETIPIPLFQMIARGTLYGEKYYGTFLYSGQIQFQVNRIVYKYSSEDAAFTTNLELGQQRPDLAEEFGKLKYELEQLRGARL